MDRLADWKLEVCPSIRSVPIISEGDLVNTPQARHVTTENPPYGRSKIKHRGNARGDRTAPFVSAQRVVEDVRLCSLLAVDIKGFGERGEDVQHYLRRTMYQLLIEAVTHSGVTWDNCHHEDRGDGIFLVAPAGTPSAVLIDPLVDYLRAGLRQHNKIVGEVAKIQLRMSVHAGSVRFDPHGVGGKAVIYLFRMLEAAAFKRRFADSNADFGMLASNDLYESVIKPGTGLIDPAMYAPLKIYNKEVRRRAWLFLPPVSNPFLRSDTPRRSRRPHLSEVGKARSGTVVPCSGRPQRSAGSQ